MIRQGDVLLIETEAEPMEGDTPVEAVAERLVLANGGRTGHAHAISVADAALWERGGGPRLLVVARASRLLHEEHAPLVIPVGRYLVQLQRRYVPADDEADRAREEAADD